MKTKLNISILYLLSENLPCEYWGKFRVQVLKHMALNICLVTLVTGPGTSQHFVFAVSVGGDGHKVSYVGKK